MERTKRGKYEGRDTNWEESKLGSYANSEIRLTEIQEQLCSDLSTAKDEVNPLFFYWCALNIFMVLSEVSSFG